ncbi:hypothetical protein ACFOHK_15715 [Falsigemmobacter intermedius]|mgnify:CR=1 FL=1|uniref:hypothetical protein n=1 Tax=Falsigemmobacter intermedius TaxID=1553448 RepID=UPI0035E7A0C5
MSPDRLTPLIFLAAVLIVVAGISITIYALTRKGGKPGPGKRNKGREGKRMLNPKTGTFH